MQKNHFRKQKPMSTGSQHTETHTVLDFMTKL